MELKYWLLGLHGTQDDINKWTAEDNPNKTLLQATVKRRNDIMEYLSRAGYRVHWLSYECNWAISLKREVKQEGELPDVIRLRG